MNPPLVVTVGSVNIDLISHARRLPLRGETLPGEGFSILPGGKGANQALRVAMSGGRSAFVGTRGADVFATFHGMQMHGPATQPVGSADGMLRPGGVEFLSLDATAGQPEVAVTVTVDPGVAPRLRIGRIR